MGSSRSDAALPRREVSVTPSAISPGGVPCGLVARPERESNPHLRIESVFLM